MLPWPTPVQVGGAFCKAAIDAARDPGGGQHAERSPEAHTPARQPKFDGQPCPNGAEQGPSEPEAVMAPSTRLRQWLGTAREPTASAMAEAVQASANRSARAAPSIRRHAIGQANRSMPAR